MNGNYLSLKPRGSRTCGKSSSQTHPSLFHKTHEFTFRWKESISINITGRIDRSAVHASPSRGSLCSLSGPTQTTYISFRFTASISRSCNNY